MNEKFYEMQKPPSNFGIGILILWGSLKAVKMDGTNDYNLV